MKIVSRFRFALLAIVSLFLFYITYYLDNRIITTAHFPTKVWFFFFKSYFIFCYGMLLFITFHNKWTMTKKAINPLILILSIAIFLGNILSTVYIIELYKEQHITLNLILLNDDNKVLYSVIAGYLFGYALFNRS